MRFCLRVFILIIIAALAPSGLAASENLRDVLRRYAVPVPDNLGLALESPITSYATLDDATDYVIGYYKDDSSGALHPPLLFLRYDKAGSSWKTGALLNLNASLGNSASSGKPDMECGGAVLSIASNGEFFFVDTHTNPSAGCLLVLTKDLHIQKALSGWFLSAMGTDLLVFHESEVHFAPTHPAEISVYDLKKDTVTRIYPPAQDSLRTAFTSKLRAVLPTKAWCRAKNNPCDPKLFSNDIGFPVEDNLAANESAGALAFVVQYEAEGFGPRASAAIKPVKVLYVYRLVPGPVDYREFRYDDMEKEFGTKSLDSVLTLETMKRLFEQNTHPTTP